MILPHTDGKNQALAMIPLSVFREAKTAKKKKADNLGYPLSRTAEF